MLLEKLNYLRALAIDKEQMIYNKNQLMKQGKNVDEISMRISVCRKMEKDIFDEKIIENCSFSKKYKNDKLVAENYFYFKTQPEFGENGKMMDYTWTDAFLTVYPAPGDDIERDLTEDEERDFAKKLSTEVNNCIHRIYTAVRKYEKIYAKNYLENKKK